MYYSRREVCIFHHSYWNVQVADAHRPAPSWPGAGPAPGSAGAGTHPAVPEELAVAAVAVLALLLVGGGGGAGAVLRAAVLVCALVPVVLLRVVHAVLAAMPFAVRVAARPRRARQQAACPAEARARCGPAHQGPRRRHSVRGHT